MRSVRVETGDSPCIFAADVHLNPEDPDKIRLFGQWLERLSMEGDSHLFLLGDIFDFWFPGIDRFYPVYGEILDQIADVSSRVNVLFVPGNRDFHLVQDLRRKAPNLIIADLNFRVRRGDGTEVYASHGDELCVNDRGYQRFKRIIRSPILRFLAVILPSSWKRRIVSRLSRGSQRHVSSEADERLRIPDEVYDGLLESCQRVIHGHTHPEDGTPPAPDGVTVLKPWDTPEDAAILR